MAVLTRHARLLYLLALFQLLGGPLVLGGLMMVKRLMTREELTLSQSVSLTLERMDREPGAMMAFDAGTSAVWQEGRGSLLPASKPVPVPKKLKEAKDKLWLVNDLTRFLWQTPSRELTGHKGWHDPVPTRLAHAPPIPPPRWS